MKSHCPLALTLIVAGAAGAQTPATPEADSIFAHAKAATVVILGGEGAGRLHSIATGVLVSRNGAILTALHAVKGAAEVQVRMSNGEVFDHVELLDTDERRDIAALKISARETPALSPGDTSKLSQGEAVYAVTNANGLAWSATEGILSAIRPADEVPGAGAGFRVLQFNAPIASGSSGGPLVDRTGALIGIITKGLGSSGLAVPIENVLGLADSGRHTPLGSGALLVMPRASVDTPQSGAAIAALDPKQALKDARTIFIRSKTAFLTVDTVDRALSRQKDWDKLGLIIVKDQRVADVIIEIDRPLFTYVHTFVVSDKRTSAVLGSGKVTAFDGTIASGGIAKDIIKIFAAARNPVASAK